mgnify:CR=1 FL=1
MANALIYCQSGGGKTCNSTLVKVGKRGRNLLLCSDNSQVVLNNFERPNLDKEIIEHWLDKDSSGKAQLSFNEQFERAVDSQKYDTIIVDNVSDLFDMAILEMDASGRYKDMRQAYQMVYQNLKRLVRTATRSATKGSLPRELASPQAMTEGVCRTSSCSEIFRALPGM